MKKHYIVPESKIFAINLKENIAASMFNNNGDDSISATAVIKFTQTIDPCRECYTGLLNVSDYVKGSNSFLDYYNDLNTLVAQGSNYEAYYKCFKYVSNT